MIPVKHEIKVERVRNIEIRKPASWVIVRIADNVAIGESFDDRTVEVINTEKYKVVPIMEYLTTLNAEIKANDKRS